MMRLKKGNQARVSVETRAARTGQRKQRRANRGWHAFLTCLMRAMSTWTV
jgi:hypothetical protein